MDNSEQAQDYKDKKENVERGRLGSRLPRFHILGVNILLVFSETNLLLHLLEVDVGNSVITIKNASNLLQSRALGLNIEEPDEHKLKEVPESVEQHEVPVVGKVVPGQQVGLVTKSKDSLNSDIQNHHALSTETEGKNLQSVSDQEARKADIIEDTEEPDEDDLGIAGASVGFARVLVDSTSNCPAYKRNYHTGDGRQE